MTRASAVGRLPRHVAVGVLVVAMLLPLVPLVVWAVSGRWRYPGLLPQQVSGRPLRSIIDSRAGVLPALRTSSLVAMCVAVLACLIAFPAGRALGLYRFRGRRLVQFLLLAPALVPAVAATLGIEVFFVRYRLADAAFGVILAQLIPSVPVATAIIGSGFANFDPAYEQQARALGASPLRTTVHVTLPLLRPAVGSAAMLAFLISWSDYVLTLQIGGGRVQTLPLLLFSAIGAADIPLAAALAIVVVVPPLVLVVVASRALSGRSVAMVGFGRL